MNIGAGIGVGFSNPREEPAFEYQESQACKNGSDITPVINNPGGTFSSSPAGLSLNSTTGVIDVSASTVGTYTVTYSIGPTEDTITILPADDASFSYSSTSFRQNASNPAPTITGLVGGVFSGPTGIIFADSGTNTNSSSGIINLAASTVGGPYTITYTTTGNCPASRNFDLSIQVALSITYSATSFCEDGGNTAAPTVVGDPGSGTFASTTGLTINSTTGVINTDTSTPDENTPYTVTYTASTGETATTQVTIKNLPNIVITPNPSLSICDGSSATLTASGGASYLWSTGATSAQITVSSSGTYSVTGTGSNGCQNTASAAFTVNPLPTISITASSTSICAGDSVTLTASGAGGGGSYSWSDGQTTAAITVTPGATITYSVTGTDANGCFNTASQQITVTAVDTATVVYDSSSYCQVPTGALAVDGYYPLYATESAAQAESSDGTAHAHTLSGTTYYMPNDGVIIYHGTYSLTTPAPTITGQSGTFSESTGNLSIDSSTGVINVNNSTAGTYTVVYTTNGSCPITVTNTVTINALDGATFAYSSNSLPQTGTASLTTTPTTSGGVYSAYPSGLSINSSTGEIDLANSTIQSYKIFYETSGAGCPNSSTFDLAVTAAGIANNYSMSFDGVNDYIDANVINLPQGNSNFSVSCWFKRSSSNGNYGAIVSFGTAALRQQFYLNFAIGGSNLKFGFYQEDYSTGLFATNSTDWYNAIVIFDNSIGTYGTAKLYVNGNLEKTFALTGTLNITGSSLNLGRTFTYYYTGLIDEVGIWNTALTSTQVAEIYNATGTNTTKDLTTVSGSNLIYWNRMGD